MNTKIIVDAPPGYLSVMQFAKASGVDPNVVYTYMRSGDLPYKKRGCHAYIPDHYRLRRRHAHLHGGGKKNYEAVTISSPLDNFFERY